MTDSINRMVNSIRAHNPVLAFPERAEPCASELVAQQFAQNLAHHIDEEIYKAICHFLKCSIELGFAISEVKDRGRFVVHPDGRRIFIMDETPLIEIGDTEFDMTGNIMKATQKFKRMYD